jgi:steroid 5-alpha reductase family enzyme
MIDSNAIKQLIFITIIFSVYLYVAYLISKDARKRGMSENAWGLAVLLFAPIAIPAYLVAVEITKLKQTK